MKNLNLFLFEGKHFVRSPFKLVALVLFVVAAVYGLHNGANLYHEQLTEISEIKADIESSRQKNIAFYEKGEKGPKDRPWVDLETPYWALWNSSIYHFKTASPAMVYSIGQAEQYGFYKKVTFWASPYDPDMTQEIANPERLQTGTLDFAFALLYLLPLLLLILLYNLGPAEAEQGFLPLIQAQRASLNGWLLIRISFYVSVVFALVLLLVFYGALLTDAFSSSGTAVAQMVLYSLLYLLAWTLLYYFLLRRSRRIMDSSLKMMGAWFLLAFVIPGTVYQWVDLVKPPNMMTELIDVQREETGELYQQADSLILQQLSVLFPEIPQSPVFRDSSKRGQAMSRSIWALANELIRETIASIEADNQSKNKLVQNTFWINPIAFFQNHLNHIAGTHYEDYRLYRAAIQSMVDRQIRSMVVDTWNEIKVDKAKYEAYAKLLAAVD